jgi:putative spermidine/putrescine transport system substrate-binding protein
MRVIKSLLALSCSISLIGQASAAGLGKGEGEVDIVAWPGYIRRGESDKNYDWVTDFEKRPAARSTSRPQAHPTKWLR